MYTILLEDDNNLVVTNAQRIMQRSKLVDELCFLVKPEYNGHKMADFTVSLEYVLPISKTYRNEILVRSKETYKDYLQFTLPFDTCLTDEAGDIELTLTLLFVDLDANGDVIQRVRKTSSVLIKVLPTKSWSDFIPDSALSALDQRILKQDAQIKALSEISVNLQMMKADDLKYDRDNNELQLLADGAAIGTKIVLNTSGSIDSEGVPVVDMDALIDNVPDNKDEADDNIVEF